MPHTSHRKKPQRNKRTEVTDADGWTRVSSTDSSQRKPRPLSAQHAIEERYSASDNLGLPAFPPSITPPDKTIDELEAHYRKIEKRWLESQSYNALAKLLKETVDDQLLKGVDKCIVFGTGSFSGLIHGWIERFEVSIFQLAAFVSVVNTLESINGVQIQAYAQEPVYNSLDIDLLTRLNITAVKTPVGFHNVSPQSFVYIPNSEMNVQLRALACNPAIVLVHGKLDSFWRNDKGEACTNMIILNTKIKTVGKEEDDSDKGEFKPLHEMTEEDRKELGSLKRWRDEIEEGLEICDGFKKDKDVQQLPTLDAKDDPFFKVHLYHRRAQGDLGVADDLDMSRI